MSHDKGEPLKFTTTHIAQLVTWLLPKIGWLLLVWIAWSSKSYLESFVANSETIVNIKTTAQDFDRRLVINEKATERTLNQLSQIQLAQDRIVQSLNQTTEVIQNLQVTQAVLDSRVKTLERKQ
mgnify:CR=1 FL=1